jgi:hypothetical protein
MNQRLRTRKQKYPVAYKEFERLMRGIREETRHFTQEALEDIFVHLELIAKQHGLRDRVDEAD